LCPPFDTPMRGNLTENPRHSQFAECDLSVSGRLLRRGNRQRLSFFENVDDEQLGGIRSILEMMRCGCRYLPVIAGLHVHDRLSLDEHVAATYEDVGHF